MVLANLSALVSNTVRNVERMLTLFILTFCVSTADTTVKKTACAPALHSIGADVVLTLVERHDGDFPCL